MNIQNIEMIFNASIKTKQDALKNLPVIIEKAAKLLVQSLQTNNKILTCGNGGSACDALHFATEMLNRFCKDRAGLPAIALTADTATLTAIANDYHYAEVFAKPLTALGQSGDVLLAISTSGNAHNVVRAIEAAQAKNISIIALTGCDGGKVATALADNDIEIRVPSNITPRIQETHILIIHCLCDYIEQIMFP